MKMKKWLALALVGVMSLSVLTACGGGEEAAPEEEKEEVVEEKEEAPAEETEDAAEAEDSEEASEETEEASGEMIQVPVTIINGTGVDIAALYMSGDSREEWGETAIPEGKVLPHGNYMELTLNVDAANTSWDMMIEDTEGTSIEFYGIDISEMPSDGFGIELRYENGEATAAALSDLSQIEGDYSSAE